MPQSRLVLLLCLGLLSLGMTACGGPPEIQYKTKYVPIPSTVRVNPKPAEGVEGTYKSLKEALTKGERILIAAGDYKETLTIPAGKTVWLLADKDAKVRLLPGKGKSAIVVEEGATLFLQGVIIEDSSRAIEVRKDARLEVRGTSFSNLIGQGIYATDAIVEVYNCTFKDITKPAAGAEFKKYGTGQGIRVKNGSLVVKDSTFEKTAERGIGIEGEANSTILRSSFKTSGFSVSGVGVLGGVALLEDLKFEGWKEALFVKSAQVTARKLNITKSTGNGILVSNEAFLTLVKSTITNSGKTGVSFFQAAGHLKENTITTAKEFCIFASQAPTDSSLIVSGNKLEQCTGAGIQLLNLKNAVIAGNEITKSVSGVTEGDGYGIACLDTRRIDISSNKITGNKSAGIYLERSTASLGDNKVFDNQDTGILIQNTPPGTTIELVSNQLDKNRVAGILAIKSTLSLRENRISNTVYSKEDQSGSGLALFESKATLVEERYESNEQHGMMVIKGSQATVSKSTFVTNTGYGVFLQCGSVLLNEDGSNTYKDNKQGDKSKCS